MEELQKLIESTLNNIPRLMLEKRLAEKLKETGVSVDTTTLSKAVAHILSGSADAFKFEGEGDITIQITNDDLEYVRKATEQFHKEHLAGILDQVGDDAANRLFKSLSGAWPKHFEALQADIEGFKQRLEQRWGKALTKLRVLLAIVMEWSHGAYERQLRVGCKKLSHLDDVLLRLLVRACHVTNEIILLLENGYADGAMARWRTLHEITIVAAVIAKFGDELAERYVYYQIVESFSAMKAYERNYKDLGFKPMPKKQAAKIRRDYTKILRRFGKKFGEEYGWAAYHLKVKHTERITFARLEEEVGNAIMRSPYKMASYNVHASPKGVYFKLGNLGDSPVLLAGATNAGLVEPAQHAAVSLAEITLLVIGDSSSSVFDDIVTSKIVSLLEADIPLEFAKADRKLRRDDRRYNQQ